jgi:hypothetical protein
VKRVFGKMARSLVRTSRATSTVSIHLAFMGSFSGLDQSSVPIAPNIQLGRFEGSQVEKLYTALVLKDGIDDGEPLMYGAYARIEPSPGAGRLLDFADSYSVVERFSTAIVVATSHPLTWSRVIWSVTGFGSASGTAELHYAGYQADFLDRAPLDITPLSLSVIRPVWATIDRLWGAHKARGRITTALQYFYLAWRSHYLEQACLHLGVAMEILFAPHSQGETTHQLAYNLAHLHGKDPADREWLYRLAKKFYGTRSAIVHGGLPDHDTIADVTIAMFLTMAAVLRRVLISTELSDILDDERRRRSLWSEFLFA